MSRKEEIDYLASKGFDFSWEKAKYSINQGIWGTSVGGVETLSSSGVLPEEAYPSQVTKTETERVIIGFEKGEPVELNGEKISPVELIKKLARSPTHLGQEETLCWRHYYWYKRKSRIRSSSTTYYH